MATLRADYIHIGPSYTIPKKAIRWQMEVDKPEWLRLPDFYINPRGGRPLDNEEPYAYGVIFTGTADELDWLEEWMSDHDEWREVLRDPAASPR